MIAQQLLNALVVGSVYALFALGFTLIFGVHHILNLAHGAVFMWGAFIGLYAVTWLHMPFAAALIVASLVAGLLSVALDWIAFRPLRKRGAPEFPPKPHLRSFGARGPKRIEQMETGAGPEA